jgi:hypothetical protein
VAVAAAIKAVLLALDHLPNFFMGDSEAFIDTTLTKWFPPQRSWTYGFFIRFFCLPVHSLEPLVIAQTLGGLVTCVALGFCLRRYFRVSMGVTTGVMIACAVDPLQLLYERMVMTEAFSLMVLAFVWVGVFAYCRRPRLGMLLILQLLCVLPFVANAGAPGRLWLGKAAVHLVASIVLMVALHGAYRAAMGIKHRQPPAYSYGTNGMVLSAFSPLLRPDDAPTAPLAAAIRDDAAYPLADRSLRNEQIWNPGGLIDRLDKAGGGFYRADTSAKIIFRHMVMRDPTAVLLSGLRNYIDYWNLPAMPGILLPERASGPYDDMFTGDLANHFHLDVRNYPRPSLTKTLHAWLPPWLVLLLASPVLLLAAFCCAGRARWRETGLLLMIGSVILAQNTMLSTMTVYRYLQPVTFTTLLALGIIIQWVRERVRG